MARKATIDQIQTFLTELGLGTNPIEQLIWHRDGSVTVYVTGLADPVKMLPAAPAEQGPAK